MTKEEILNVLIACEGHLTELLDVYSSAEEDISQEAISTRKKLRSIISQYRADIKRKTKRKVISKYFSECFEKK